VLCLAELTARSEDSCSNGAVTSPVTTAPICNHANSNHSCNQKSVIHDFLADRRARGLSPHTVQFYQEKLEYVSRIRPLLSITQPDDLQQLLASLPCNPGGRHAYLRALRAFYSWAEDRGLVATSPCRKVTIKVPKPLRYAVQVGDLPKLLAGCECLRDRLILSMLADTGLRLSELASLTPEAVHGDTATVWGKGAKQRVVRFGPATAALLSQYTPAGDTLFGLKPRGIAIMLHRLGERTGIKCHAHALRRTFATQSVRNDVNLFYIQSLLGHSTLTMTRIYAEQVNSEDAIRAYRPVVYL